MGSFLQFAKVGWQTEIGWCMPPGLVAVIIVLSYVVGLRV